MRFFRAVFYIAGFTLLVMFLTTTARADVSPAPLTQATARIIGGIETDPSDWPFMAVLVENGETPENGFHCGGSLIAATWVVTAAHCVVSSWGAVSLPNAIDVYLGKHLLSDSNGQKFSVKRVIPHPNYDNDTANNDIALLELSTAAPTSVYTPVKLVAQNDPDNLTTVGTISTAVGWGATNSGGYIYPDELRQVNLPIYDFETAKASYATYGYTLTDTMLPAGYSAGGKDACSGDSGGPLLVPTADNSEYVLAGVTSWGEGCAQPDLPGIWTKISVLASWVTSYTDETVPSYDFSDADNDGVPNVWDECADTPSGTPTDNKGCPAEVTPTVVVIPLFPE
ncbi:S1 family serine peptidase [Desulfovibrio inopinatus]|uniref:S1 family serine peptidase n=1 Tax=Desulfovibrio inopinatus TaxID=102109 RepID=UPI000423D486|nr:serine protease [Desulfovibrio inopinatus]